MFFILSKIFSFLTKPIIWILLGFFLRKFSKKPTIKKWALRFSVFGLIFFSNTVVFSEFTRLWETEGTKINEIEKEYDIGVVLGGMAEYDNNLDRLSLRRGGDRIWQALQLYYAGKIDKILICGSNGFVIDNPLNEASQFKHVLVKMGIPEGDILTDKTSKNTYQNAVEARLIAKHESFQSILLITSALHMRRSRACFSSVGFKVFDCFTTDHYTGEKRGYTWEQFLIPNYSTLLDWNKLTHEWFGYLVYDITGYIK